MQYRKAVVTRVVKARQQAAAASTASYEVAFDRTEAEEKDIATAAAAAVAAAAAGGDGASFEPAAKKEGTFAGDELVCATDVTIRQVRVDYLFVYFGGLFACLFVFVVCFLKKILLIYKIRSPPTAR